MSCSFNRFAKPVHEGSLDDMKSAALDEMGEVPNSRGAY